MRGARSAHTFSSISDFASIASRACSRSWSTVQSREATPITGPSPRVPTLAISYTAGKIFFTARSPVAPNSTRASLREDSSVTPPFYPFLLLPLPRDLLRRDLHGGGG